MNRSELVRIDPIHLNVEDPSEDFRYRRSEVDFKFSL
jgi:hypothetical protein